MENNKRPTQSERVLKYMQTNGWITQYEAMTELGVMRLASRISELRKSGIKIQSEFITVKNRFDEKCKVKRYTVVKEPETVFCGDCRYYNDGYCVMNSQACGDGDFCEYGEKESE